MAQAVLLYRHDTASLLRSQIESGIKKIECKGTLTKAGCKGTLSKWQEGDGLENYVEKLRKEYGLNQEEFARAIRVSRQTVSSIETGKYNPSLELAFTIADFFGKTIEEIFIHKGDANDEKERTE